MKLIKILALVLALCSGQILAQENETVEPTVKGELIQILAGTREAAKEIYGTSKEMLASALEKIQQETPELIKQYISWHLVKSSIEAIIIALAFTIYCIAAYLIYRKSNKNYGDEVFNSVVLIIAIGVPFLLVGGPFYISVMNVAKILTAPKIFLIESIYELIKK